MKTALRIAAALAIAVSTVSTAFAAGAAVTDDARRSQGTTDTSYTAGQPGGSIVSPDARRSQ
jgi:uncharacterized spore protein YtfJ